MAMVEFELSPVVVIEPWGQAPNLSLHWFGLSYGSYYFDLGTARLLEYAAVEGWPRFVEYQLARLHEDLIGMLPDVVEVVPRAVSERFRNGSLGATHRHLSAIWSQDAMDENLDVALEALRVRSLYTEYLSPSAGIWIWSSDTKTIIEWDNRDRLFEGRPVWTAQAGRFELNRQDFLHEVRAFDTKLMEAMSFRVRAASASWTRPEVKIDVKKLAAEQVERGSWFDSAVRHGSRATDWQAVQEVLSRPKIGGFRLT
jgi:hypothetical protein